MRKIIFLLVALAIVIGMLLFPGKAGTPEVIEQQHVEAAVLEQQNRTTKVVEYLHAKGSPLSTEEATLLVEMPHGDLLIAISAIESQYCKRQLGFNCWGIGGDSAYRHYDNFSEAIIDANNLVTRWQERGRWLTVEDMNCHYVVPCNPNWVNVVNKVLLELENI